MKSKTWMVLVSGFGALFLLLYLMAHPVWSSFYRACETIEVGMSEGQVGQILAPFTQDSNYQFSETGKGVVPLNSPLEYEKSLMVYTEAVLDEYHCNVFFNEEKVLYKEVLFD